MMKTRNICIAILLILLSGSAYATIRAVNLIAAAIDAPENRSNTLTVLNSRIQGFRLPFITGKPHHVTIFGNLVDLCDRVEICSGDGGTVLKTIRGTSLKKSNENNEGKLEFNLSASDLPAIEGTFNIRVRYAIETSGFDRIDCKVIARGVINTIEWIGTTLPLRQVSVPESETSILQRGSTYTLRMAGTGLGTSVQLNTGSTTLFNSAWPVSSLSLSSGRILLTFTPGTNAADVNVNNFSFNPTTNILLASDGVGNGVNWGPYIFHSYAPGLSTTLNFTNLNTLSFSNPDVRPGTSTRPPNLVTTGTTVSDGSRTYIQLDPTSAFVTGIQGLFGSPSSSNYSKASAGNNSSLGAITVHEIVPAGFVINVINGGTEATNVTPSTGNFNVRVSASRISSVAQTVSANPVPFTAEQITSSNTGATVNFTATTLTPGQVFSRNLHHTKVQVFTFSNRSGQVFIDSRLRPDTDATVTTDTGNVIRESNEQNNSGTF